MAPFFRMTRVADGISLTAIIPAERSLFPKAITLEPAPHSAGVSDVPGSGQKSDSDHNPVPLRRV